MSQTSVQRSKALRFGSGVLEISYDNGSTWTNLGALKGAKMEVTVKISEILFDNAKLPPKKKVDEAIFSATLAEINLPNVYALNGQGALTLTPASPVTVTAEVLKATGTWATGEIIYLDYGNGDGTVITPTNVKNGATTLTAGTDFQVVLTNGKTGLVRLGTNLTLTGIGLNSTYTYTPNASNTLLYKDILQSLSLNRFRFMNTDENGKKFGIEIFQGYNRGGLSLEFRSDDDVENVMEMPIELKAYPDGSNQLFQIYDEQDA